MLDRPHRLAIELGTGRGVVRIEPRELRLSVVVRVRRFNVLAASDVAPSRKPQLLAIERRGRRTVFGVDADVPQMRRDPARVEELPAQLHLLRAWHVFNKVKLGAARTNQAEDG